MCDNCTLLTNECGGDSAFNVFYTGVNKNDTCTSIWTELIGMNNSQKYFLLFFFNNIKTKNKTKQTNKPNKQNKRNILYRIKYLLGISFLYLNLIILLQSANMPALRFFIYVVVS